MLLPKRKWKDIKGYENLYQISNTGEVRSLNYRHTGKTKILKPRTTKGYKLVHLCKNGKCKNYRIHRLVAEAFLENPNNLPEVNHIDENKSNNVWTNLEWCDHLFNVNYGTRNERARKKISEALKGKKLSEETKRKISEAMKKKVKCITTDEIFTSIHEASRKYNVDQGNIAKCCRGERKSAGKDKEGEKLIWKYLE